jgi:hypothetical protein
MQLSLIVFYLARGLKMKIKLTTAFLLLLFSFIAIASDRNNQDKFEMVIVDASSYAECYEMAKNEHSQCISEAEKHEVPERNDRIESCNRRYDDRIKVCETTN